MSKIIVETEYSTEQITQNIKFDMNTWSSSMHKEILKLKDKGIREALIKMGWTPPEQTIEDRREIEKIKNVSFIGDRYAKQTKAR
jgi:hypothetical protein